jgi:methyl-accepting chemotaxis protein
VSPLSDDAMRANSALLHSLDAAIEHNATLKPSLDEPARRLATTTQAYVATVAPLIKAPRATATTPATSAPRENYAAAARVADTAQSVVEACAAALDTMLASRIGRFQTHVAILVVATVLGLVAIKYLGFTFYLSFNSSVSGLSWFAGELAQGNLTVFLADNEKDELSSAARLLSKARDSLRKVVKQMVGLTGPLSTTLEEVSNVTRQTSDEIRRQQCETDQVATAMNDIACSAQEIARNADSAAQAARSADGEVTNAHSVVNQSMQAIDSLAQDVARAADVIRQLALLPQLTGQFPDFRTIRIFN